MCGVPVHAAEGYLARLIKAGCRVAIAEQVESPAEAKQRGGSKALVARDIVRFVTAGTLTEEALLEPRRANVLAAVCEMRGLIGIAACDISTGRMELEECAPDRLGAALARLGASEVVVPEGWEESGHDGPEDAIARPSRDFSSENGESRLQNSARRRHARRFRQLHPRHAGRSRGPDRLSRPRRARFVAAVAAAGDAVRRSASGDGRGDARQPRNSRLQPGWAQRQPDRRHRSLRHRRGRAAAGGGFVRPADQYGRDQPAAGTGAVAAGRNTAARGFARRAARAARYRQGAGPGGGGARLSRAILASCATGWARRGG